MEINESLNKLKTKCIKSNFNPKLTENQVLKIQEKQKTNLIKKNNLNIYWSSQFNKLKKTINKRISKTFPTR